MCSQKTREQGFLTQVLDAAVQRRFMEPWNEDKAFVEDEGRIIYAVDMDVVYMYANPWDANSRTIAYGQVFSTDSRTTTDAVTMKLADFLFYRLSPDFPLLVIPPIESELEHFLSDRMMKFGEQAPSNLYDIEALKDELERAEVLVNTANADISEVLEVYAKVQRLMYYHRGAGAEFRRVLHLLEDRRIAGPDSPDLIARLGDSVFEEVLKPFHRLSDFGRHIQLKEAWSRRIARQHASARPRQLENDASAMARLQMWNERLAPHKRKIVYITGARGLFETGLGYTVRLINGVEKSFADAYLRHPRAFVAEPTVLDTGPPLDPSRFHARVMGTAASGDTPSQNLLGALRVFLTSFKTRLDILDDDRPFSLRPHSRKVALAALAEQESLGQDIRDTWEAYAEQFRADYRPAEGVLRHTALELSEKGAASDFAKWTRFKNNLDAQVDAAIFETWDKCFRVATSTGFAFDIFNNRKTRYAARSVPPLSFDRWPQTHAFIEKVSRWHSEEEFDGEAYKAGTDAVQLEDPTGYAYYLAHAALFGGRGKWGTAALLAERALLNTKARASTDDRNANGREAAYLLAVCRRHTAKAAEALDGLSELIDEAETILQSEASGRDIEAIPERFRGERIAIDLTRLLFQRYVDPLWSPRDVAWENTRARLISDIRQLDHTIQERLAIMRATSSSDRATRVAKVLRRLDVRVITNFTSLKMIDTPAATLRGDPEFIKLVRRLAAYGQADHRESEEISFYVGAIALCSALLLETDPGRRQNAVRHLRATLSNEQIDAHSAFPYDRPRYAAIREAAIAG